MENIDISAISLEKITIPQATEKNVDVSVLRLDKIHQLISGNKWFKLQYYLADARKKKKHTIITRGGAWSNHIIATAAACQVEKFQSIGLIRGEEPRHVSATLRSAKKYGMELFFMSRENYRNKRIPEDIHKDDYYFIEEGGYGRLGMHGAATILSLLQENDFTHIACAVGTGTMLAGLAQAAVPGQQLIGISVLKGNYQLHDAVNNLLDSPRNNFIITHDYHFGGYARDELLLIDFMNAFYKQTGIPSDFVYTGKLFYALNDLIDKKFFPHSSRVLVIHSGGLQGNASLNKGTLIF